MIAVAFYVPPETRFPHSPSLYCAVHSRNFGPNPEGTGSSIPADQRLPNGKSQKEEILKADHEKSLDDAGKLMELTEELKIELEKTTATFYPSARSKNWTISKN